MKTFKRFSAAKAAANGHDIVEVRLAGQSVYIVSDSDDANHGELSVLTWEPALNFRPAGYLRQGYVTPRHLKRLGNANWAKSPDEIKAAQAANEI